MAEYPNSVYAPRAKANRTGVVYDAAKTTVGYVEDVTKLDAEVVAVETELGLLPKGTSASVLEKIKGLRSLSDATADTIIVKGGNVGIGTTSPAYTLDIQSSVSIYSGIRVKMPVANTMGGLVLENDAGSTARLMVNKSTIDSGSTNLYSTNDLALFTGGSEVMRLKSGNVGIGVTSPTAKLHLAAGTATASTAPLKFTAGVVNTTKELGAVEFIDDGTTGHLYITLNVGGVLTRKEIAFVA
jgi:hypothetical protein